MQQQALPMPPSTHLNSISRDSVDEARKSHRPGDEMVGLKLLGCYGLMDPQVGADYNLLKHHHCKNGRRRSPSPTY
jgi:hypothetical protein